MKQRGLKKTIVLLLVTAMLGAALVGCKSNDTTKETQGTDPQGKSADKKESSGSKDSADGEKKAEITMMTFDFDGSPLSGKHAAEVLKKLEDYTNTKVNFDWVPSDNYEEKLTLALADPDSMPMIMAVGSMNGAIVSSAEAGGFWDLNEFIKDSAAYPNLSQANENVNKALTIDGQLIGIYRARPIGRNGIGYRKDWADKLGLSEPKTIDDIYNMMYQFTYGDPDGNGKDDTYGVALCKYTGPFDIMQTWLGCGNGWVEKDGQLVPVHQTEEYMEALHWFKKMYDDGLVYKDWAVRDTATWADSVKNGECGMYVDVLDGSRRIWDYFETNQIPSVADSNELASMNLIGSINGKTLATSGFNGFFVITKAADTKEKVADCLHFLDAMNDDEMLILSSYGLEGIHWEKDTDGNLVDLDLNDAVSVKDYGPLNQTVAYIPNLAPTSIKPVTTPRQDLEEEVKQANIDKAVFNPAAGYLVNSSTYALNGATLDEELQAARTQYICGEIDENGLKKAWKNWEELGGADVIKEVNEQYQAEK